MHCATGAEPVAYFSIRQTVRSELVTVISPGSTEIGAHAAALAGQTLKPFTAELGGNAANTFVLVYNLYDTQDLYHRFPAAEGTAYLVGGFTASYLRWGNVVLIPIRLGVGYRLGVNAGYMKFSEKRTWLPF